MSKLDKSEQLLKQIKKGNTSQAKKLLSDPSININMVDKKTGKNLLQLFIQSQQQQLFDHLISHQDINLNLTNIQGTQTILQTAVLFDNIQAINKLISKGVDITKTNSRNESAIDVAIIQNKPEILSLFWKHDSELIVKSAEKLFSLGLENSSTEGCLFLIKSLPIKSLTRLDGEGNNIIHLSVEGNKTLFVKELLGRIAANEELTDVEKQFAWNSQNKKGDTYLHIAHRNQFQTIITLIQNPQYNVFLNRDIKNQKGQTVKDVIRKTELSKESQVKRQQKMREQKKQREIQKQQQRKRQIQTAERQKIEEKEAAERQQAEENAAKQQQNKKSRYIALLILILVIIITYYGLDYVASNSKKSGVL